MKIIFCDIDGVLNNVNCYRNPRRSCSHVPADPMCVAALNHIIEATDARIVISSAWRYEGLAFCREKFNEWGVLTSVIGITPCLSGERGLEISEWLNLHDGGYLEPSSFVILDADSDMSPFMDRLVQTSFQTGLTMADAERAIAILEIPVERGIAQ